VKGKLHWVSDSCVSCEFRLYEPLFLIDEPLKCDNFWEYINPNSKKVIFLLKIVKGIIENNLKIS